MKRNGAAHRGGRASVRWQGEAGVVAFRRWRMALEGGGSPASTLQVGEMMGRVRGGLSGKSEEGCVRAGVLTRKRGDGGATAFHEADGGRNGGISGGAADVARGRGRGELSGAELRWPFGTVGGFVEEKWRESGVDPGSVDRACGRRKWAPVGDVRAGEGMVARVGRERRHGAAGQRRELGRPVSNNADFLFKGIYKLITI
jgi:hypothetical protein